MQYDQKELEATLRQLEHEADTAERAVETLAGQLDRLRQGLAELERRETSLVLDLDNATRPNNLARTRSVADLVIEIAQVRAGIDEVGRFIRDHEFRHRNAKRDLEMRQSAVSDFKKEYSL